MRIEDIRREQDGARARIAATVIWEDCHRPRQKIYFETVREFGPSLSCEADAFLVACLLPAMREGEERIWVDSQVCPELRYGLGEVMSWMRHWFALERKPTRIEAKSRMTDSDSRRPKGAGFFLSGGIDSLATLCLNRRHYPEEHPGRIKDGLLIYGMNIESDDRLDTFERAVKELTFFAEEAGVTLIPVYTNIRRDLNADCDFFLKQYQASCLTAVAHALAGRIGKIYIASGPDLPNLTPYGTHPVLDLHFSSSQLRIKHHAARLSRVEKAKLVADWEPALQNIKVCPPHWPGLNCGRCEKCLRTMLELVAAGALGRTRSFVANDVSEDLVRSLRLGTGVVPGAFYRELIEPLTQIGRTDLVRGIHYALARARNETGWKGPFVRIDRKYFKRALARFKRRIMPPAHTAL